MDKFAEMRARMAAMRNKKSDKSDSKSETKPRSDSKSDSKAKRKSSVQSKKDAKKMIDKSNNSSKESNDKEPHVVNKVVSSVTDSNSRGRMRRSSSVGEMEELVKSNSGMFNTTQPQSLTSSVPVGIDEGNGKQLTKRKSVKLDAFHQQVAKLKEKRKSMGNINRVNVVVSDLKVEEGADASMKLEAMNKKLNAMKQQTKSRRDKKRELRKKRQENRKQLDERIQNFFQIVQQLEPKLQEAEEEKELLSARVKNLQVENSQLTHSLEQNMKAVERLLDIVNNTLTLETNPSKANPKLRPVNLGTISANLTMILSDWNVAKEMTNEVKRRGSVFVEAGNLPSFVRRQSILPPEALSAIPNNNNMNGNSNVPPPPPIGNAPPPPPMGNAPPPPLPSNLISASPDTLARDRSYTRSDLLSQIKKRQLKHLDEAELVKEREERAKPGIFASLQATVKMALDIRKKAMEANEDSDEDDWSDEEDY